jgi:hypothetical protein
VSVGGREESKEGKMEKTIFNTCVEFPIKSNFALVPNPK